MDIKYNETNLSNDLNSIIKLVSSSFSSTQDSSLDQWLSFSEMKKLIKDGREICIKAIDFNNELLGMIYAQQENPINNNEVTEKWVIIVLAVLPEIKGKGIGSNLLEKIAKIAK